MNSDPEKMKILLKKLETRTLDREEAKQLIPLLRKELESTRNKGNYQREGDIAILIDVLESYIRGTINLMIQPMSTPISVA